jgi:hypothetical protein
MSVEYGHVEAWFMEAAGDQTVLYIKESSLTLNQLRDSTTKARGFYFLQRFDSTGRLGSRLTQTGGGHDIGRPFL